MKTIETVQQYNAKQLGANMMFLNANGSPTKRGFVVTINGASKLCKTLAECEAITEEDFQPVQTLPCYSNGGTHSILTEMNN